MGVLESIDLFRRKRLNGKLKKCYGETDKEMRESIRLTNEELSGNPVKAADVFKSAEKLEKLSSKYRKLSLRINKIDLNRMERKFLLDRIFPVNEGPVTRKARLSEAARLMDEIVRLEEDGPKRDAFVKRRDETRKKLEKIKEKYGI